MKYLNLLSFLLLLTAAKYSYCQKQSIAISSPNKKLSLTIFTTDKKLVYSVKSGSTHLVEVCRAWLGSKGCFVPKCFKLLA